MPAPFQPNVPLYRAIFQACDALAQLAGTDRPDINVDPSWTIEKKGCHAIVELQSSGFLQGPQGNQGVPGVGTQGPQGVQGNQGVAGSGGGGGGILLADVYDPNAIGGILLCSQYDPAA